MRFLLDECLSPRLAPLLAAEGHDVAHIAERQLLGETDAVVFELAALEKRVLVSADTDFGEILARRRASKPSLVLFRRTTHTPEEQAAVLLANLAQVAEELESGAIVVLTDDRIRVRQLPVG